MKKGLSLKESLTGILSFVQYHNNFKNVFTNYEHGFKKHSITTDLIEKNSVFFNEVV